eukprot:TRINITY_DN47998_c0_g1_i1.p1 TRINITY_DN47998_c0_g1~~TRINITY_DN47998_c0_g1_i1.p1  ORF type:complete len:729 (-),score=165.29 TRINITY_DN47998_c0_g1_i1:694-2880(-)
MEEQVLSVLHTEFKAAKFELDDDIMNYLASACLVALEDSDDQESAEQQLQEVLDAQLEEAGDSFEAVAGVCRLIAAVKFGKHKVQPPAAGEFQADSKTIQLGKTKEPGELLCCVEDLFLMYGGSSEPLLSNTKFEIRQGHRYGIVGCNGTGKTSLMLALLSGAVKEMPPELKLVHVHGGTVMELGDPDMTASEVAERHRQELGIKGNSDAGKALEDVGFIGEMQQKTLSQLSGGWRMRLALACAMLKRCDVLLLDEPTNHLDAEAVAWLANYLKGLAGTSLVISHQPDFLDQVCTDIIHFDKHELNYHKGNFEAFVRDRAFDSGQAQALLETRSRPLTALAARVMQAQQEEVHLTFPIPGRLDGIHCNSRPIVEMKKVSFQYDESAPFIIKEVSGKLSLNSKVAVVGANGSGKSTLLSVLCGENSPSEYAGTFGEVIRHRNMRLSYIAQHHVFHLEEFWKCTPLIYFQIRFRNGYDQMLQRRLLDLGSSEEQNTRKEMAVKLGKYGRMVHDIVGRQKRGRQVVYEVAWEGLEDPKQNTWETFGKLKKMKADGIARAFDERLAAQAAGIHERPLSEREIVKHLELFQINEEIAKDRTISKLSSGQKSRLMLAAAFWTKPHLVVIDEPTNYLDPETVDALMYALQHFRGGFIASTHCQRFVDEVCSESWTIHEGAVSISKLHDPLLQSKILPREQHMILSRQPPDVGAPLPTLLSAAAVAADRAAHRKVK